MIKRIVNAFKFFTPEDGKRHSKSKVKVSKKERIFGSPNWKSARSSLKKSIVSQAIISNVSYADSKNSKSKPRNYWILCRKFRMDGIRTAAFLISIGSFRLQSKFSNTYRQFCCPSAGKVAEPKIFTFKTMEMFLKLCIGNIYRWYFFKNKFFPIEKIQFFLKHHYSPNPFYSIIFFFWNCSLYHF